MESAGSERSAAPTPMGGSISADSAEPELALFRTLVASERDAAGLLAYALHRQTFFDWSEAFARAEGRTPSLAERRAFLIGEAAPRRISEYRERAARLMAPTPAAVPPARPRRTMLWPFGPGLGIAVADPARPLNWRGLAMRLAVLLVAVIVTALALRMLVVPPR